MFKANVYKIAVLSLFGIMKEVYAAQESIRKWNQENAERTGKLFLLLAEEATDSNADVVIGIVGNYIEKAEVVEEAINLRQARRCCFSSVSIKTWRIQFLRRGRAVDAFKKKMVSKCFCSEFSGRVDFEKVLFETIQTI